jgi:hypothetical protein
VLHSSQPPTPLQERGGSSPALRQAARLAEEGGGVHHAARPAPQVEQQPRTLGAAPYGRHLRAAVEGVVPWCVQQWWRRAVEVRAQEGTRAGTRCRRMAALRAPLQRCCGRHGHQFGGREAWGVHQRAGVVCATHHSTASSGSGSAGVHPGEGVRVCRRKQAQATATTQAWCGAGVSFGGDEPQAPCMCSAL